MKQRWWMFAAGSVTGAALGVGLGMWGARDGAERRVREEVLAEMAAGGVWGVGGRRGGERSGPLPGKVGERGWGGGARAAGVEDLLAMVGAMSRMDDLGEMNFMELVRQSFSVTQMSEGEVLALLAALEGEEFGEMLGDNDEFRAVIGVLALSRLAEVNGPEAIRLLMAAGEDSFLSDNREEFAAMCMTAWVAADAAGAMRWMEECRGEGADEELQELVMDPDFNAVVASALARNDRAGAMKFLDAADKETRAAGLAALARQEVTTEGISKLLDATGAAEVEVRRSVLEAWAYRDPKAAAAWLDAQGAMEGREELLREVAENYVTEDPAAGAAWYMAQEVPEGKEGERYEMVVQRWRWRDAKAAGAWLEGQADGPARDAAEVAMTEAAISSDEWSEAFRWVGGISDDGLRSKTLEEVLDRGVDRGGSAGRAFAEAAEAAGFGEAVEAHAAKMRK